MILRFLAVVLIQIFFAAPVYCASQIDLAVFKDSENGFSIKYPKSWVKQQPTQEKTKFKVTSKSGNEGCSVNIQYSPHLVNRTPRDFIDGIKKATKEQMQAGVRKGIQNAVMIDSGKTVLSNQPAFFQQFSFSNDAENKNDVSYSIITINNGKAYTVACISDQSNFDKSFGVFKVLMVTHNCHFN